MKQTILQYLNKDGNKLLYAILAVSVLARIASALYLGNTVQILPGTFDQISYHRLALRVLDGHGFSFGEIWWPITGANEPTAHWSFLYTSYLIVIYKIFGTQPVIARLIQAVIVGILHPYMAYKLGRTMFSKAVGLIAAAWTALYIYFIYYAGALMTEPFYITTILIALYLSIQLVRSKEKYPWKLLLGLGATLAITILLRQLFLMVAPFFFLWIWWASGRRRFWQLAVPVLVIALSILPISLYNYSRFDHFVLLNTNSGYAFFWGNHPIYGTHFESILPPEMGTYQDLIPEDLRHLNEAELDSALMDRAWEFIFDDPGRYVLLSLSRIPAYFMFWPSPDSGFISNFSRVFSFGISLPFMLMGLWIAVRQWRWDLSSPFTLLCLFGLAYTGIHMLSWALVRYRLPVDAVLLIYAGLAVERILAYGRQKDHVQQGLSANAGD